MSWLPDDYKVPAIDIDDEIDKGYYQLKKALNKDTVKVYFAGKMSEWRSEIYDDILSMNDHTELKDTNIFINSSKYYNDIKNFYRYPVRDTIWKNIKSVGPYRIGYRNQDSKNVYKTNNAGENHLGFFDEKSLRSYKDNWIFIDKDSFHFMYTNHEKPITPLDIRNTCINSIKNADVIIGWLDSSDCHGTIAELGVAYGLDKPIITFCPNGEVDGNHYYNKSQIEKELWFSRSFSELGFPMDLKKSVRQNFQDWLNDYLYKESVYLMQYGQSSSYKIGKTSRTGEERVKELNGTKAPNEIILHEEIFTDNASFLEKVLHQRFSDSRTRGEWFELKPEQIFEFVTLSKVSKFHPLTKDTISALEKNALIFSESQQIEHDLFWKKYNQLTKSNHMGGKSSSAKEAIRRLKEEISYIPALS